jgi:anti-sigma-K factor RskA
VQGDVVWSTAAQEGYMRLAGRPVNDPSAEQYQLWIVDPARDSRPLDGGVLDVDAETGEVVIPIDAKLAILQPAAFALTLEQPGGVVVSAGPLLVVAAVES